MKLKKLNKKKFRGKDCYLVQWKGYIAEEDMWEPEKNPGNVEDLVKEFEKKYKEVGQVKKKNTKEKKERENYWKDIWKSYYMDGIIKDSIMSTRDGWRGTGKDRKEKKD